MATEIAMSGGQGVVVANEYYVGGMQRGLNLGRVEQRVVGAKGLVELAKIFAAVVRIVGADFALHSG